jgi:site-specific DNA-methyltransferase (adenine-specific)
MVEVFREVRRVLRSDGTVFLNLGDSYCNAGSSRNGEGLDGNRRGGATGKDGKLGYKKRDIRRTLLSSGIKHKDLVGIPWMVAFALRADGWYLRQDIIWHKPNPMPESVTDRCTKAHEYIFLLSKSARYFYDAEAVKETNTQGTIDRLSSGPVQAMGTNPKRLAIGRQGDEDYAVPAGRNRRSVWTVTTKPFKGAHFATFPPDLIEPCIKAGCPEGGTVLDPFLGSGTTAAVARKNGCRCVGIELNEEYLRLAARRLEQGVLF